MLVHVNRTENNFCLDLTSNVRCSLKSSSELRIQHDTRELYMTHVCWCRWNCKHNINNNEFYIKL